MANELDQDKDFDPSAEALIDEIDDERTLEEEEALAGADSTNVQNEIDDLKRESEMPIEELLAYYGRMRNDPAANNQADHDKSFAEDELEDDDDDDDADFEDDEEDDKKDKDEGDVDGESEEVRKKDTDRSGTTVIVARTSRIKERSAQQQPRAQTTQRSTDQQTQPSQSQQSSTQISNSHLLTLHQQRSTDDDVADVIRSNEMLVTLRTENQSDESNSGRSTPDPAYMLISGMTSIPQQYRAEIITEGMNGSKKARDAMRKLLNAEFFETMGVVNYLESSDDCGDGLYSSDDSSEGCDFGWRRRIRVGPLYQGDIPDSLSEYENDLPPYENEDTLVWRGNSELSRDQIIDYLKQASMIPRRNDISLSPASVPKISDDDLRLYSERVLDVRSGGPDLEQKEQNSENIHNDRQQEDCSRFPSVSLKTVKNCDDVYMAQSRKRLKIDKELEQENASGCSNGSGDVQTDNQTNRDENSDSSQDNRLELSTDDYFHGEEQILYLLLQCNHNVEEALRRRRLDPFKYYISEPMSLWSQDECLGFEHGLRTYGKDFRLIRDNKVPTRTRAEVVAFYYLWKKSERHDVYTNQYRLNWRKSINHPGTTDYMDRFIEDNEPTLNASSSTPTLTPTDSTAGVNQVSHIASNESQPKSNCPTSGCGPIMECSDSQLSTTTKELNNLDMYHQEGTGEGSHSDSLRVDSTVGR